MDLKELEHHAKSHGSWSIQMTTRDKIVCEHHSHQSLPGMMGWEDYAYFLNGKRINYEHANRLLDGLFAGKLGLRLVDIEA